MVATDLTWRVYGGCELWTRDGAVDFAFPCRYDACYAARVGVACTRERAENTRVASPGANASDDDGAVRFDCKLANACALDGVGYKPFGDHRPQTRMMAGCA